MRNIIEKETSVIRGLFNTVTVILVIDSYIFTFMKVDVITIKPVNTHAR